nr:DUF4825 domain-containing protein [uncultured Oscillibacter sp.]
MKNDLTCGVVRDLLPSYVEGLLGEESREAVDRHLESCPECREREEAMASPAEAEGAAKEVDFLKRVKKGTAKKVVLAVLCTVVIVAAGFLAKEFVIGRAPDPEMIDIELAQVDGENNLTLLLDTYWGAYELRGLKADTKDRILRYTAREVRRNLFQDLFMQETKDGMTGYWKQIPLSIPLKGLDEVWICGRLVWQDGMVISKECLDLLELRTPYCGDAPALGRIARTLNLQERLGDYTTELQTSKRPYSWNLYFKDTFTSKGQHNYMTRCEYLMLALVDNLDCVRIYPPAEEGEELMWSQEMPLDAASRALCADWKDRDNLTEQYNKAHGTSWTAKTSVKDYVRSPADFQRLLNILDYNFLELRNDVEE